jgi:threonyl-tRNA synthetase
MLVVGDREVENSQVALRLRNGENPGPMSILEFIDRAKDEISRKI